MRFLEAALIIITLFISISNLFNLNEWNKSLIYTPVAGLIILTAHGYIDGIRWQLYPIYFLVILYFFIFCWENLLKKDIAIFEKKKFVRIAALALSAILIITSVTALFVFPLKTIKKPSGTSKIGTVTYEMTDPNRKETYGDNSDVNRRIMVQLWYPTDDVKGLKKAPWIEGGRTVARGIAEAMHLPKFVLDHAAYIMSNSYEGAKLSDSLQKYPVIVISHGWTGFRDLHLDFAEELASNGYIVAAIDHTFGSDGVVFPDGKVAYLDRKALPERSKTPDFLDYAFKLVSTYTGDIKLVVDELEKWNIGGTDTQFNGRLDLEKLGVIGHSTGGGAAVKASIEDYRIKALIGLDAWVESLKDEQLQAGTGVPSLYLRSESWQNSLNNKNLVKIVANNRNDTYFYQIQGTNHFDFSMVYMYSTLVKKLGFSGSIDSETNSKLLKDYMLTFFNEYLLKGEKGQTEKLQQKYEMVKLLQMAKKVKEQ